MSPIKQKIKELSSEQVMLKNQRRTVRLVGERTMSPVKARYTHSWNRLTLSCLFIAYAIIRGKDPAKAVSWFKPDMAESGVIKNMIDDYTTQYEAQKESDLRASQQAA